MKYFIKAFFGEWVEVSKEKYEHFRKNILVGAVNVDKTNPDEVEKFEAYAPKILSLESLMALKNFYGLYNFYKKSLLGSPQ